jgi:PTH1 family peptidyl-tRNA hydrolase
MNDSPLPAPNKALIAGLGNPGRRYSANRHNIGFMLVDQLARQHDIALTRVQNKAIVGAGRIGGRPVILAKPQTYMNNSGDALGPLAAFYRLEPADVLVAYDEIDLPLGTLRLRESGSSGGHNGMRSIIAHLGEAFPRLRLGVSRPPARLPAAAYVLQDFASAEAPIVTEMLAEAARAVETFLTGGIVLAMSRHNGNVADRVP